MKENKLKTKPHAYSFQEKVAVRSLLRHPEFFINTKGPLSLFWKIKPLSDFCFNEN